LVDVIEGYSGSLQSVRADRDVWWVCAVTQPAQTGTSTFGWEDASRIRSLLFPWRFRIPPRGTRIALPSISGEHQRLHRDRRSLGRSWQQTQLV